MFLVIRSLLISCSHLMFYSFCFLKNMSKFEPLKNPPFSRVLRHDKSKISTLIFSGDRSSCLKDKPQKAVALPLRLPGEIYTADDQCARAFGDKSHLCSAPFVKEVSRRPVNHKRCGPITLKRLFYMAKPRNFFLSQKICLQLWCVNPKTGMCTTHREPASEGTSCGHKMVPI